MMNELNSMGWYDVGVRDLSGLVMPEFRIKGKNVEPYFLPREKIKISIDNARYFFKANNNNFKINSLQSKADGSELYLYCLPDCSSNVKLIDLWHGSRKVEGVEIHSNSLAGIISIANSIDLNLGRVLSLV